MCVYEVEIKSVFLYLFEDEDGRNQNVFTKTKVFGEMAKTT